TQIIYACDHFEAGIENLLPQGMSALQDLKGFEVRAQGLMARARYFDILGLHHFRQKELDMADENFLLAEREYQKLLDSFSAEGQKTFRARNFLYGRHRHLFVNLTENGRTMAKKPEGLIILEETASAKMSQSQENAPKGIKNELENS